MAVYIFALIGIATYILLDLTNLQKSTPELALFDTIKAYFGMNLFYILAGMLITYVVIATASEGETGFLNSIGIDFQQGKGSAFFIGLTSQVILSNIRKFINPVSVETKNDSIVMTKKK
jgi:hypothetical protein